MLDFCYVLQNSNSLYLQKWLDALQFSQHDCGLVPVPHMRELYALFHASQGEPMRGISTGEQAHDVSVSTLPKDFTQRVKPLAWLSYNKDGYSSYCREYKSYWQWVGERNEARYENTIAHGKNYDTKNMMHTFRLLHMAQEIAREGKVHVRRSDREFLLRIKAGEMLYDELVARANELIAQIEIDFAHSDLPDEPDAQATECLLVEIREAYYKKSGQYGH